MLRPAGGSILALAGPTKQRGLQTHNHWQTRTRSTGMPECLLTGSATCVTSLSLALLLCPRQGSAASTVTVDD